MTSETKSYEEVSKRYSEVFSISFLTCDFKEKIALIAMVCYLTDAINKKRGPDNKVSCYDVLLKIDKTAQKNFREDFLVGLGVICDDFMKGSNKFDAFGIDPNSMPDMIRKILDSFLPF